MGNHCCGHAHGEDIKEENHGCCGGDHHADDGCGCGHSHDHTPPSPEEIAELMKAIEEAGYKVEGTPDGDIKISEK